MFSSQIVTTDAFVEMPLTSQALYFHLGMAADDDGFVSPRKVVRMIGAGEDDMKILLAKNFVIPFESGVIVITHWKQNNYLRNDRYTPTIYKAEMHRLSCGQGVYSLDTIGIPLVSQMDTQVGREEGRKKDGPLNKNEDRISDAKRAAYFEQGRAILRKRMTGKDT